jgi:peroxiredoxin
MVIKEGSKPPALKLPDADGRPVSLADFAGRHVVVYFYPARRHARLHQGGLRLPRPVREG